MSELCALESVLIFLRVLLLCCLSKLTHMDHFSICLSAHRSVYHTVTCHTPMGTLSIIFSDGSHLDIITYSADIYCCTKYGRKNPLPQSHVIPFSLKTRLFLHLTSIPYFHLVYNNNKKKRIKMQYDTIYSFNPMFFFCFLTGCLDRVI